MEKEMQEYQKSASELYSKLRQDTVQLLERVGGDTEDLDKKFPVFLPAIYLALHERSRSVSSEASRWNSHGPGSHPGPDGILSLSRVR